MDTRHYRPGASDGHASDGHVNEEAEPRDSGDRLTRQLSRSLPVCPATPRRRSGGPSFGTVLGAVHINDPEIVWSELLRRIKAIKERGHPTGPELAALVEEALERQCVPDMVWQYVLVLARKDEQLPVAVRLELRDYPSPESFTFTVEDECSASESNGWRSSGYLRLTATLKSIEQIEGDSRIEGVLALPMNGEPKR